MDRYKLSFIIHESSEDMNDKFMAEVPGLARVPGLGRHTDRNVAYPGGVAEAFIQSYLEYGHPLPAGREVPK